MVLFTKEIEEEFNKICHENGYIISHVLGAGSYGRVYQALRGKPLTDDRDDLGVYAIKLVMETREMNEVTHLFSFILNYLFNYSKLF